MKFQASVLFFGALVLAACSGSSSSTHTPPNDSVDCSTAVFTPCNTPSDCGPDGGDGTGWSCTNDTPLSACNYAEPVCVAAPDPRPSGGRCKSASQCTGALPRTEERCADGTFSGASWACKSDTCEVTFCQGHTKPVPGTSAGTCNQPTDCTGFLPQNQEQCADGTFSGASWACDSNTCTISYCANDGGLASSSGSSDGGGGGGDSDGGTASGGGDDGGAD
jgi:uncharacterized membrane protein YgcG